MAQNVDDGAKRASTGANRPNVEEKKSTSNQGGLRRGLARFVDRYAEGVELATPDVLDAVDDFRRVGLTMTNTSLALQRIVLESVGLRDFPAQRTIEDLATKTVEVAGDIQKEITKTFLKASVDMAKTTRELLDK